jgi:hypothetical protein
MIANLFKQLPQEAVRAAAYVALAGLVGIKVFPVLREWDVFSAFPSKAYMEREVCTRSDPLYIRIIVCDGL